MSNYPEHDKLAQVRELSQTCGEFFEWLTEKYTLAQWVQTGTRAGQAMHDLQPVRRSVNNLLADFFGIDEEVLEEEKRRMLDDLRQLKNPAEGSK